MTEPNFAARNQTDVLVRQRKDILTIPWLCATALIGAYAGVLAYFGRTIAAPLPPGVGPALIAAAGVLSVLSVALPQLRLGDKQLKAQLQSSGDTYGWARRMRLRGAHADAFRALPPEEQRLLGLTLLFQRPYALGLGLANGVASIGLVYGSLNKTLIEAAPFLLVALALNCWHYPRLTRLIDRGRNIDRGEEEQEAIAMVERLEPMEEPSQPAAQRPAPPRAQPRLRRPSRPQGPTKD